MNVTNLAKTEIMKCKEIFCYPKRVDENGKTFLTYDIPRNVLMIDRVGKSMEVLRCIIMI